MGFNALLQHAVTFPGAKGFENGNREWKITKLTYLSGGFKESSGLETTTEKNFLTHKDSGFGPVLYQMDFSGYISDSISFYSLENKDWEDITQDNAGNYYIGDFGNNLNKRRDLCIYKIGKLRKEKITFEYADQHSFPPKKRKRNFDCEAFFWHDGDLFLFTKNRGNNWVKAYKIPAQEGHHKVSPIDSMKLPQMITAADVDRENNRFALLGYGVVYYFKLPGDDQVFSQPESAVRFIKGGQSEGFAFMPGGDAMITNERGKFFIVQRKLN